MTAIFSTGAAGRLPVNPVILVSPLPQGADLQHRFRLVYYSHILESKVIIFSCQHFTESIEVLSSFRKKGILNTHMDRVRKYIFPWYFQLERGLYFI